MREAMRVEVVRRLAEELAAVLPEGPGAERAWLAARVGSVGDRRRVAAQARAVVAGDKVVALYAGPRPGG